MEPPSEMKRNGYGDATLPLDMVNGKPRIHVVKGRDPSSEYHHEITILENLNHIAQ